MNPVVHKATLSLVPKKQQLPLLMADSFLLFNRMHALWNYYRKGRVYANPENFGALLAGHAVHHFARDHFLIRIAAQCVLISMRVLACAEQYMACCEAYQVLCDAIEGSYPLFVDHPLKYAAYRINEIAVAAFQLLFELFQLSMCYMDALAALSFSADTQDDGIREIFYNSFYIIDQLTDNKERLLSELKNNQAVISVLLQSLPGGYKVESLINAVTRSLQGADWLAKKAKKSPIVNFVKGTVHNFLLVLDLPTPFFPFEQEDENAARFPPRNIITIPLSKPNLSLFRIPVLLRIDDRN